VKGKTIRLLLVAGLVLVLSAVTIRMIYGNLLFAGSEDYEVYVLITEDGNQTDVLIEITGIELGSTRMTFHEIVFHDSVPVDALERDGDSWTSWMIGDYFAVSGTDALPYDTYSGRGISHITFKFLFFTKRLTVYQRNVQYDAQ